MPPYLAIFMSTGNIPLQVGLFTLEEFDARFKAGKEGTAWATVLNTETGEVIRRYSNVDR